MHNCESKALEISGRRILTVDAPAIFLAAGGGSIAPASCNQSGFAAAFDRARDAFANYRAASDAYDAVCEMLDAQGDDRPKVTFGVVDAPAGREEVFLYSHDEIDEWIDARLAAFWWPDEQPKARALEARRAELHSDLLASHAKYHALEEQLGVPAVDVALERAIDDFSEAFDSLLTERATSPAEVVALAGWAINAAQHSHIVQSSALALLGMMAAQDVPAAAGVVASNQPRSERL